MRHSPSLEAVVVGPDVRLTVRSTPLLERDLEHHRVTFLALTPTLQLAREVRDRPLESFAERDGRCPPQQGPGALDVWATLCGVILRQRAILDRERPAAARGDLRGELTDGEFSGVSQIDRLV